MTDPAEVRAAIRTAHHRAARLAGVYARLADPRPVDMADLHTGDLVRHADALAAATRAVEDDADRLVADRYDDALPTLTILRRALADAESDEW